VIHREIIEKVNEIFGSNWVSLGGENDDLIIGFNPNQFDLVKINQMKEVWLTQHILVELENGLMVVTFLDNAPND
jgi:hypothetical protein